MGKECKENLYEVEFESLIEKEVEKFEYNNEILKAKLDISVTLGSCIKNMKDILSLKGGDIVSLDKAIDEDLDININNKRIAVGGSIKIEDKMFIRISEFRN